MEYNATLRSCPNCAAARPSPWRQVLTWRWPWPLAIGLALQVLSQREGPAPRHAAAQSLSGVGSISQFIAGMLVFSALAALLLLAVPWAVTRAVTWARTRFRRRARRRQRRAAGK